MVKELLLRPLSRVRIIWRADTLPNIYTHWDLSIPLLLGINMHPGGPMLQSMIIHAWRATHVKAYTLAYLERLYTINGYQTLDQIHGHLDVPCLSRIQIHGAEVDPWRGSNRPNMWAMGLSNPVGFGKFLWPTLNLCLTLGGGNFQSRTIKWDNTRNTRHQEDATPSRAQILVP